MSDRVALAIQKLLKYLAPSGAAGFPAVIARKLDAGTVDLVRPYWHTNYSGSTARRAMGQVYKERISYTSWVIGAAPMLQT